MNALQLIGAVGAKFIAQKIADADTSAGVARLMLDKLQPHEVAAIVKEIRANSQLANQITIQVPRIFAVGTEMPADVLTDERTVSLRNRECSSAALLLVNTDDDQETSLGTIPEIGAKDLTSTPALWVEAAASNLHLDPTQTDIWTAALKGLIAAETCSLMQLASYVALTRSRIDEDSRPLLDALGWALPSLNLFRDPNCFNVIKQHDLQKAKRWEAVFDKLIGDRRPLLNKQRKNGQQITSDELQQAWLPLKDTTPPTAHATIEAFIAAPPLSASQASALAQLEWEADGLRQLFHGFDKQKKLNLAAETLEFFDLEKPTALSADDKEYLEQFKKVGTRREADDDDHDFFQRHSADLSGNKKLRAKWEKLIFGKPIECHDFLMGLVTALERLANCFTGEKSLVIRTTKRFKKHFLDLNEDIARSFSLRYRGLPELMGPPHVTWDTQFLFSYEAFIEEIKTKRGRRYKRNVSIAKDAIQIVFEIYLVNKAGEQTDDPKIKLIWHGQPNAIGIELDDDLDRLEKAAFTPAHVERQTVSKKGALQGISLADVTTLRPAYQKDSGSLIPKISRAKDLQTLFLANLTKAEKEERLSPANATRVRESWAAFSEAYNKAISDWRKTGICSPSLLVQAERYGQLLADLANYAGGGLNRRDLWEPVAKIGVAAVNGGAPAAIVAPWHPLRLAAMAIKARSVAGLYAHVLSAEEVNFGDPQLFFKDLRHELSHAWYPEIAVGFKGIEPVLLSEVSTLHDYSLMETPVPALADASTDVEPKDAANEIQDLVARYLELQPHEAANLSIMLYNCDAAGLAFEAVNSLSSLSADKEIRCNVLVRHRDRQRLGNIYGELVEYAEADPDALSASATSQNFMSKLRIGVMLTSDGMSSLHQRGVDVAFLHDVVSRQAKQDWVILKDDQAKPDFMDHTPARWSYRQVSSDTELKATNFLLCPRQPAAGWAYANMVAALVQQRSIPAGELHVPVRQISFGDQNLKEMFDEVHQLAEWVATYDDLLDRRQLRSQGINIIRYRRQKSHGRNMIVSSKSDLNLLRVLVVKRLSELALGLDDQRMTALAERMINDALQISGDVVLRAAKRGVSAGELIGLVLSRALVAEELGSGGSTAWFLLDDYATWLGQREQGIADILGLNVCRTDAGTYQVRAVITEAKYVNDSLVKDKAKESEQQLRETIKRMDDALFGAPGRLDRDLWLARIADLLLDSNNTLPESTAMLEAVRDGLRQGIIPIDLRGYSHVFAYGPADDSNIASDHEPLVDVPNGLQEVFNRTSLRSLVKAYEAKAPLMPIREQLGQARPWETVSPRNPAKRVNWSIRPIDEESTAPPSPNSNSPTVPSVTPSPAIDEPSSKFSSPPPPPQASTAPTPPIEPIFSSSLDALIAAKASRAQQLSDQDDAWLNQVAQQLRSAMMGYGLHAKVLSLRLTPNAALIHFQGSDKVSVEQIEARRLALLTTHGLKLISVTPMPGEIVVAVERPQRQVVSLWDLWARRLLNRNAVGVNTSFVLGLKEIDGELLYLNLGSAFADEPSHDPHTLIAGATGSGKSVLIQALLLDIAATNTPQKAKIILIDPKMGVDYSVFEQLPHLDDGIVINQTEAIATLEALAIEMDRRYELFRAQTARDLKTYNAKVPVHDQLPMIYLVHDEFAEWMLTENYKDAVTATVGRLGVKARAAGIHLIFAAQRPDAGVMPVQLRDNLGNRLILKVSSVGTSEIALGHKGAEALLGNGHLAARLQGRLHYAQAPYLSDDDQAEVVGAIRRMYGG